MADTLGKYAANKHEVSGLAGLMRTSRIMLLGSRRSFLRRSSRVRALLTALGLFVGLIVRSAIRR